MFFSEGQCSHVSNIWLNNHRQLAQETTWVERAPERQIKISVSEKLRNSALHERLKHIDRMNDSKVIKQWKKRAIISHCLLSRSLKVKSTLTVEWLLFSFIPCSLHFKLCKAAPLHTLQSSLTQAIITRITWLSRWRAPALEEWWLACSAGHPDQSGRYWFRQWQ